MHRNVTLKDKKVGSIKQMPLLTKILVLFAVFILMSNLASNYINSTMNRGEILKLANRLLVKDLKELYGMVSTQYAIFELSSDARDAIVSIEEYALKALQGTHSTSFGLNSDGTFLFWASASPEPRGFQDIDALTGLLSQKEKGTLEGSLRFSIDGSLYFSVYKYNEKWKTFLIRAEKEGEFYAESRAIFVRVSIIIGIMTLACLAIAMVLIRRLLSAGPKDEVQT